jgi:hypothetical protein
MLAIALVIHGNIDKFNPFLAIFSGRTMNLAYLFTLPELLTEDNLPDVEIKGLAEWSDHVPALFLLLIGADPAICTWPVYDDGNHPPAFICPWGAAAARLSALMDLMQSSGAAAAAELSGRLVQIHDLLHRQRNEHVVLEFSEVAAPQFGRRYQQKGFKGFMADLKSRADTLAEEFEKALASGGPADADYLLSSVFAHPQDELGYWDARVATGYWLAGDPPQELPDFLSEFSAYWYQDRRSASDFDQKLGAYQVCRRARGAPPQFGLVTAYDRWLRPLAGSLLQSNRYDGYATRGWIVIFEPVTGGLSGDEGQAFRYGLLDANGVEVLPMEYRSLHTMGNKLAVVRSWANCQAGDHSHYLLRLDTGEYLPGRFDGYFDTARSDGFIEAGLDSGEPGTCCGLLDYDGRRVTEFVFSGISQYHRKHKLAIVKRGRRCGLIDQSGNIVLPIEYQNIAHKIANGAPHFHGDATLIFTAEYDERGVPIHGSDRVGVADRHGKILAPPRWHPWHLQYTFDKEGRMLVHEDGVLYHLHADGSLSEPLGSYQATIDELVSHLDPPKMDAKPKIAASTLAAKIDRAACDEFIEILCRGNDEACAQAQQIFANLIDRALAGDDDNEAVYVTATDRPATPFFRPLAFALGEQQIWMHLDWKAVEEISRVHSHLPDLAPLAKFRWDGLAHGEGIADGFIAIDVYLAAHGYRLLNFQTDGDYYMVGAIESDRVERCMELGDALGIPMGPVGNAID